ncbi:MAG: RsmD family RNA methyltransferase [Alphaproteobacteria bacterium]|nr:RsmD family RNA methyltransferase [Alphaproteobacteria bacterium]
MDSKLQIISGAFRGRKLRLPPNARPTQNRARIALFNMLESGVLDLRAGNLRVWDAFAGSGAFGIECLSRYAGANVLFTDVAASSIKTVRDNLGILGCDAHAQTAQVDAIGAITKYGADMDVVFLDPPYTDADLGGAFVRRFGLVAKSGAILIWEQEVGHEAQADEAVWNILRDKRYGRARFLILRKL